MEGRKTFYVRVKEEWHVRKLSSAHSDDRQIGFPEQRDHLTLLMEDA